MISETFYQDMVRRTRAGNGTVRSDLLQDYDFCLGVLRHSPNVDLERRKRIMLLAREIWNVDISHDIKLHSMG